MKKTKKKFLIILLIVLLLGLAVGYAAFSDVLTITGTANADGTFDLIFQSATTSGMTGVNETDTKATISADGDTLTVVCADLAYPGAGCQYNVVIKNVGTIPAKVKSVTPTNIEGNGSNIKIDGLDAITTSHPVLNAGDTCNLAFTVYWDPDSEDPLPTGGETCSFELVIEYEQATEVFGGAASHIDL